MFPGDEHGLAKPAVDPSRLDARHDIHQVDDGVSTGEQHQVREEQRALATYSFREGTGKRSSSSGAATSPS